MDNNDRRYRQRHADLERGEGLDGTTTSAGPRARSGGTQALHKSRKGRYWIERWSQWQGSRSSAEWISKRAAAAWLLMNNHAVPDDLAAGPARSRSKGVTEAF